MRSFAVLCALFAIVFVLPGQAGALLIEQVEPDNSLAEASWSIDLAGDQIEVDLTKQFKSPEMMGCPLVLVFTLEAGDAGRDIWLTHDGGLGDVGEEVFNLTEVDWVDFHFVLVNVSPGFPAPLPQYAGAAFTDLGGVTSDVFGDPVSAGPTQIDFAGGPVPDQGVVHFSGIHISHNGTVGGAFYLKEIPTPEPVTLCMLLAGAALLRRRRG